MISKYPNFSMTLLLAFILVPPFVLSTLNRNLEPYPAIILPAGAGKINVEQKEVSFKRTTLWSKDKKNGTWKRINAETFFAPIPVHYFNPIVNNEFGLNSAKGKIYDLPVGFKISTRKVNHSELQKGKQWLSERLVQSGYASDEIMITLEQANFDIETGQITTITRNDEKILRLD